MDMAAEKLNSLRNNLHEHFAGKESIIDDLLICILSDGHVLMEDVPGVGKTTLARILARSIDCDFGRIQFKPDTLPGDVTGSSVYNMKTGEFTYREGAIMHQIILADEINRTSPRTQASLLEAMAEGQVSVDGKTYPLPQPFMVIATQNPVEFMGTYPLPEAQMDRFMMRLSIGYPDETEEIRLAKNFLAGKTVNDAASVLGTEDIINMKEAVKKVHVSDGVISYIRDIIRLTREENSFVTGASPRAMLMLIRSSQAHAYINEREFVKPDDVKAVAVNVLHHRLSLTPEAKIRKEDTDRILKELILKARIPTGT